jgi:hypothetical protein
MASLGSPHPRLVGEYHWRGDSQVKVNVLPSLGRFPYPP